MKQDVPGFQKNFLLLFSFFLYWGLLLAVAAWIFQQGYLEWPFTRKTTALEAYQSLGMCFPLLCAAIVSLLWLRSSASELFKYFQWKGYSPVFGLGLLVSVMAALFLFVHHDFDITQWIFWPVAFLFSLCIAFSEEVIYRMVFYVLVLKNTKSKIFALFFQSVAYATPHYFIGGRQFMILAFAYGILLGVIFMKNASILPSFICHFFLDIGYLGLPFFVI